MTYAVRFTTPSGGTGQWQHPFETRDEARAAIRERKQATGYDYAIVEAKDPPRPPSYVVQISANGGELVRDFTDLAEAKRYARVVHNTQLKKWTNPGQSVCTAVKLWPNDVVVFRLLTVVETCGPVTEITNGSIMSHETGGKP